MKKGLQAFRHLEGTLRQIPKQRTQMKKIGFRKSQPAKKQTGR